MATDPAKTLPRYAAYGGFARDSNRQPITGSFNYFMTVDASGTPVNSPVAVTTAGTLLIVPNAAAQVTLCGSAAFNVGEDSAMTSFFTVPANTPITIPTVSLNIDPELSSINSGIIYLNTASGTSTISFMFECV